MKHTNAVVINNLFVSPSHLLECFDNYLDWLNQNQLREEQIFGSKGEVAELNRMRAPSIQGFAFYLRTNVDTLKKYAQKDDDYSETFKFIGDAFHALCYEGAAAGLFKESIVIRKLGLADKHEKNITQRRVVIMQPNQSGRVIDAPEEDDGL